MARGNGHLEWESSKDERYAENWWTEHGFEWKLTKRFVSKSVYDISKDGITMAYEVPNVGIGNMNMKKFMGDEVCGFVKHWEINKQVLALRKQANQ